MNNVNQGKGQAGYGLVVAMVFIAVVGFLAVQLVQHYTLQREASDMEIRRAAGELKIVQEQSLGYFYDNERWPSSIADLPEASGLTTVQMFDMQITPPASDALSFELTAASEDQARMLTRYMVNGVSDGLVVTSTLPPPYEVVSYDDYVQRYASTTAPERNVLEQDILANNQAVYNIDEYTGERIESEEFVGDTFSTNEANVSDELTIGAARVTSTGSQMNVSSAQSNFGNIQASMAQLSAGGATGQASANRFQGANFTASDVGANENQIYAELTGLQAALDECMYETKYCFPQPPVIDNVSCPACDRSEDRESFSARITARVSSCPQGCSFNWSLGNASGFCATGTVNANQFRNLTCDISASVDPQSEFNTVVRLSANNQSRTDLIDTHDVQVRWANTTSEESPIDDIRAGCAIGRVPGAGRPQVSEGICDEFGAWMNHSNSTTFSVGDAYSDFNERYTLSDPGRFSVSWSGDCVSNNDFCTINQYNGPMHFEATAVVVDLVTGEQFTSVVRARDCIINDSVMPEPC